MLPSLQPSAQPAYLYWGLVGNRTTNGISPAAASDGKANFGTISNEFGRISIAVTPRCCYFKEIATAAQLQRGFQVANVFSDYSFDMSDTNVLHLTKDSHFACGVPSVSRTIDQGAGVASAAMNGGYAQKATFAKSGSFPDSGHSCRLRRKPGQSPHRTH